jgi:uncharacterized protein YkwD
MFLNREILRARRGALIAIAISLAVLGAACVPRPSGAPSGGGPIGDIISRHNSARANAGLPQFAVDGGMSGNAQAHANRLASGAGGSCNMWHSSELGSWYSGHAAAENIACVGPCPGDGAQMMNMWLNSPEHRANLLNGGYRYIGVGAACNGRAMFAVVHFRN